MWAGWKSLLLLAVHFILVTNASSNEKFEEELFLETLTDGKVAARFEFKTLLKDTLPRDPRTLGGDDVSQHYTLFPLALGQILREYAVTELHLTLNAGKWKYERWGIPKEPGVGTGAELWTWMGDGAPDSIDTRWRGLRNALAGLFCASLGSLDELRTTSPARTFEPEGALPDWGLPHQIRHASLPSEHVCTENLTPFLKLLPCKSHSGLASLLNPHRLFDADWHGMGIHVLWRESEGIEVRLTFMSIFDPLRSTSGKRIQVPDWSFQSLFDRTVDRSCPVAQSSRTVVARPSFTSFNLSPDPVLTKESFSIFDVDKAQKPFNVAFNWLDQFRYPSEYAVSPLTVRRSLQGTSQAHGRLSVVIENHLSTELRTLYLETMPWLVQFYLHTINININGQPNDQALSNLTYIPSIAHSRPTTFQAVLTLPPRSKLHLTMDVTKAFLRYTEHPPDAQRGWDLPPAIITILEDHNNTTSTLASQSTERHWTGGRQRIYTPTLLVDLATPDFSMPYNVIIFTCSLIALLFGNVFNLLTKKLVIVNVENKATEKEKVKAE
ncbi:hypothetical protein AX16_005409 [Volvariella volvacea WC 439]|nr:hypothetical protein AX16_005409 [Volvariella volvacea WC 439]